MRNYVIINGVNSNTINGLGINELPPITKPLMRSLAEEIDGRDGDITTNLGYSAYDKTITIGLFGTGYDINNIVAFFNGEGTIVFSNESDKYYKFKIINQIDYSALQKFKFASVTFHCQPFKYPLTETPLEIEYEFIEDEGESLTLNNTGEATLKLDLLGNTSQTGTPTPSTPIPVNVVSGDNEVVVCGKNLFDKDNMNILNGYLYGNQMNISTTRQDRIFYIPCKPSTTYTISRTIKTGSFRVATYNSTIPTMTSTATNYTCYNEVDNNNGDSITITTDGSSKYLLVHYGNTSSDSNLQESINTIQVEVGSTPTSYEPYQSQTYEVDLPVENLFNINATPYQVGGNTTYSVNGNTLNVKGEWFIAYKINVSKNTDYYISANRERISGTAGEISIYDGSVQTQIANASMQNYTFNSGNNSTINIVLYAGSGTSGEANFTNIQLERGTKANHYTEYNTTPIELCKIGDYQDYFTKNSSGQWCKYNAIGKVVLDGSEEWNKTGNVYRMKISAAMELSPLLCNRYKYTEHAYNDYECNTATTYYNINFRNSTITSVDNWKTEIATNNLTLYYVLATPTTTEITDTNLIEQLDNIQNAMSYEGQTNISQVNDDKAFIISVKAVKKGTNEVVVNNIGNVYSKPLIALEGSGNIDIYLDNTQILKANVVDKMNIDIAKLEAYNPDTSALLNRQVIGNYNTMTLQPGNNTIKIDGALDKATISNYTRYL